MVAEGPGRGPQRRCAFLPDALELQRISRQAFLGLFWVFAQHTHSTDPRSGVVRRHHMYDQTFSARLQTCRRTSRHHEARHTAHPPLRSRRPCSAAVTTFEPCRICSAISDVSTTMISSTHAESWRCRSAHRLMRCRPSLVRGRAAQVIRRITTPLREGHRCRIERPVAESPPASADGRQQPVVA